MTTVNQFPVKQSVRDLLKSFLVTHRDSRVAHVVSCALLLPRLRRYYYNHQSNIETNRTDSPLPKNNPKVVYCNHAGLHNLRSGRLFLTANRSVVTFHFIDYGRITT